ncbi:MAG: carbohydrate kinase family protein, partial [Anaerolineales bacterium]
HIRGETHQAAGGAALYTALAAHCAGADAALFAPRPKPMHPLLAPIEARTSWIGPVVQPRELPRLEIEHHGGGQATLLSAAWGAEEAMRPAQLPDDLTAYDAVHIAALGTAQRQLDFLRGCRARGARRISVGTYARVVYGETDAVRALLQAADLFFMNENEAKGLFGSVEAAQCAPGKLLFVTRGERGARVLVGDSVLDVEAAPALEIDPTGAGDTFCGATLAHLARGEQPVAAAREAVKFAALTLSQVGPGGLLAVR